MLNYDVGATTTLHACARHNCQHYFSHKLIVRNRSCFVELLLGGGGQFDQKKIAKCL